MSEITLPPTGLPMNIVLLCDGTANQVSLYAQTNVLRLARVLARGSAHRQVVYYDPGLGTEGAPGALTSAGKQLTKFLGLVFGYGLAKNLGDAYRFLMTHYRPGDRIYIFGFSRGAYTARALAGLLGRVGLLDKGCENLIPYAIKYFKARDSHQLNFFKQRFARTYSMTWGELIADLAAGPLADKADRPSRGVIPVHFLGVWDTVKSIGTLRRQIRLPDTSWLPNVLHGRHAVALDEKRSQYKAELWTADTDDGHTARVAENAWRRQTCLHRDLETMWFPGVHADVGGGYGLPVRHERDRIAAERELRKLRQGLHEAKSDQERQRISERIEARKVAQRRLEERMEAEEHRETGLAYLSLRWMMKAAARHGLRFDRTVLQEAGGTPDPNATLHDPMLPFWWILGSFRRTVPAGAQVHPSAFERMRETPGYRPAARGLSCPGSRRGPPAARRASVSS